MSGKRFLLFALLAALLLGAFSPALPGESDAVAFKHFDTASGDAFRYYIINETRLDENDRRALLAYIEGSHGEDIVLVSIGTELDAADLYESLQRDRKTRRGNLAGIQIIGTAADVPAFGVQYKIQMLEGIDEGGEFKTDHFYSNLKSDAGAFTDDFSIYKAFAERVDVEFLPQWEVARLPLTKGEIAAYFAKYTAFIAAAGGKQLRLVNFSSPIFPSKNHVEDMGYFLDRLAGEFGILNPGDYVLYGNREGLYPITTPLRGDCSRENIRKENRDGIVDFIINSHGQSDNFDRNIFVKSRDVSRYRAEIRFQKPCAGGDMVELRISFLNSDNINDVLSENYYTLTLWSCLSAHGLGADNIIHTAMARGKCVSALAASSILSNNGIDNRASLQKLQDNNPFYFMYHYFRYVKQGYAKRRAYFLAKREYVMEIVRHTDIARSEGNYQFNLFNALSCHYLGI